MKKYKIIYVIIYLLLLILVFTKGINIGIKWNSYDDYRDKGIIDGFSGSSMFLIYNFIIVITVFLVSLIITIISSNKIKYKKWIFIGILILLLFIPTYFEKRSGGVDGIIKEIYINTLTIPIIISMIIFLIIPIGTKSTK